MVPQAAARAAVMMAGSSPAMTVRGWSGTAEWASPSVQRLELDDRGAVVAADPEGHRRGAVVDEHAPYVGRARQQIFDELAGLGTEPQDAVPHHRAGPGLAVLVERHVVGRRPGGRGEPFLE